MAFSLAPGIGCCAVDGVVVFLDVNRDRYFALGTAASCTFVEAAEHGGRAAGDGQVIDDLVKRGILVDGDDRQPFPWFTTAPPIEHSALDGDIGPCSIGGLIGGAAALAVATARLRWRPLRENLDSVTRSRVADAEAGSTLARAAIRFESARRYLPFARSCLRDSLALLLFLRSLPERPRIVFGVRTDPFRAHCWVQHRGSLLNEVVDHARLFTPILVG